MNKGDVKIVANAYVLEGRAKIELGDSDKGQEDIEKAVTFLTKIAEVKSEKDKLDESFKFCDRAIKIGKENVVNLDLMEKVLALKLKVSLGLPNKKLGLTRIIDVSEDFYNLKAKDKAQYEFCLGYMQQIVEQRIQSVGDEHGNEFHRALALQGKALRRHEGVDEAFDAKPWRKYTESDDKFFVPLEAFKVLYHDVDMEDPWVIFSMMDVNGVERVHLKDAPQMMLDLKVIDGVEDDGVRFVE